MKIPVVLLVLVAAALALDDIEQEWAAYKAKHNKKYSGKEDLFRKELFVKTKQIVEEHNKKHAAGLVTYTRAVNQFADLTPEESRRYLSCLSGTGTRNGTWASHVRAAGAAVADEVDWRAKGAVTRVKYQGMCGSCWAFSAIGALEGLNFLKHGKLVELSEQNLVDCDRHDKGCHGGFPSRAYHYIIEQNGVDTEASYPYDSAGGHVSQCRYKADAVGARVASVVGIKQGSEEELQHAVATVGPISVAIDAGQISFHQYGGGVYYDENCSERKLTHAVTLVGFGTQAGQDYWLVKNSWDETWGERGYVKMARNRNNQCGIATLAVYPIVV
ncbi:procathepsin L-like [Aricia agestis]|uniref:procathepsin L-like n=1 Tax=Aricia agestis TaxID=91739 RepID=UPI001C20B37F|nr:procathepsin L-like [Aricia agestis]